MSMTFAINCSQLAAMDCCHDVTFKRVSQTDVVTSTAYNTKQNKQQKEAKVRRLN
jgi:hypothetical protein